MNQEEIHWYYIDEANNDAQIGPFVLNDFKGKFLSGKISPDTYSWHEELDDWEKLSSISFRGKPAITYLSAPAPTKPPDPIIISQIIPASQPDPKTNEKRLMTIEEEIKERIRKKFAK